MAKDKEKEKIEEKMDRKTSFSTSYYIKGSTRKKRQDVALLSVSKNG